MGLGFLQLLKLRGPGRIVAIDVRAEAREKARELGTGETYHPDELPDACRLTRVADWEIERGFDVVIEASGTQPGLTLAGELVRGHGVLSILGYHQGGDRQVDMQLWNWKAIDVVNAHVNTTGPDGIPDDRIRVVVEPTWDGIGCAQPHG
jgi:threonine dehydrogenase-like Zn-dependent dehydrogenase